MSFIKVSRAGIGRINFNKKAAQILSLVEDDGNTTQTYLYIDVEQSGENKNLFHRTKIVVNRTKSVIQTPSIAYLSHGHN